MESILLSQANHLIKKAIIGPPGTPDWTIILQIIGICDSQSDMTSLFIDVLQQHFVKDPVGLRMNCLILLDSLFKNGKKDSLKILQTYKIPGLLSSPSIDNEPLLHNFVHKSAPGWVSACVVQKCLVTSFEEWQRTYCSNHFVPTITPEIRSKFNNEIEASIEVLLMFSQCMIAAFAEGKGHNTPLIQEILPNVKEIRSRTAELLPSVHDRELKSSLQFIGDYSSVCLGLLEEFKKKGSFDTRKASNFIQKATKRNDKVPEEPKKKKKITGRAGDDMTEEEFFIQLQKLKERDTALEEAPLLVL